MATPCHTPLYFSSLLYLADAAFKFKLLRKGVVGPGTHNQFEWGDDKMRVL
jgi:hypothetical protein